MIAAMDCTKTLRLHIKNKHYKILVKKAKLCWRDMTDRQLGLF